MSAFTNFRFKKGDPSIGPGLRKGSSFTRCSFDDLEYSMVEYSSCYFYECTFKSSVMCNLIFRKCYFTKCTFKESFLVDTVFINCKVNDTKFDSMISMSDNMFEDCEISYSLFRNKTSNKEPLYLDRCKVSFTKFDEYCLDMACFADNQFSVTLFNNLTFNNTSLDANVFIKSRFEGIRFDESVIDKTIFIKSLLKKCSLTKNTKLKSCSFTDSLMTDCEYPPEITLGIDITPQISNTLDGEITREKVRDKKNLVCGYSPYKEMDEGCFYRTYSPNSKQTNLFYKPKKYSERAYRFFTVGV